jgi:mannose-6-phosphate isomerase-like protein (cupin superfamily)
MSERAVIIPPGQGHRVGNVEFLARTADTPRFNFSIIEIAAGRELEPHVHEEEDDAFYVLEGEMVFTVEGRTSRRRPGHSCWCHRASSTRFTTRAQLRSGC